MAVRGIRTTRTATEEGVSCGYGYTRQRYCHTAGLTAFGARRSLRTGTGLGVTTAVDLLLEAPITAHVHTHT